MTDSLNQLFGSIVAARSLNPALSRTARLLGEGSTKIAKKLVEEAAEVGLEAVQHHREGVVLESADLLYNLCVLWAATGITPAEVEAEIERRTRIYGIAEKLPKQAAAMQRAMLKVQEEPAVLPAE